MEKNNKGYSKIQIASLVLTVLALVSLCLPISTGISITSLNGSNSFNLFDLIRVLFGNIAVAKTAETAYRLPLLLAIVALCAVAVLAVVQLVLILRKTNVSRRRMLSVAMLILALISGVVINMSLTSVAKTHETTDQANIYEIYPEFTIKVKYKNGSVNNWTKLLEKYNGKLEELYTNGEDLTVMHAQVEALIEKADTKAINNVQMLEEVRKIVPLERQEEIFPQFFKKTTKVISTVKSTFGIGFAALILCLICLTGTLYSERNASGYKTNGIAAYCMFAGLGLVNLAGILLFPLFQVTTPETTATGLNGLSLFGLFAKIGTYASGSAKVWGGFILLLVSIGLLVAFVVLAARRKAFRLRKLLSALTMLAFVAGGLLMNIGFSAAGQPVSASVYFWFMICMLIALALLPHTVYIDKETYKVFSIVNVILFVAICAFIIVPIWKVFVDSLDSLSGYGMRMWPQEFSIVGYKTVLTNPTIYRPFLISVVTTVCGTLLGLTLSTLGAYVLIQFEMPGRNLFANLLLFTMIFSGGMIPTYLVMKDLHLLNTLWAVILPLSINVYNLVLMRNFFEGIPKSLFESASIDGCSPMGIFIKIVLPLSKAALASIGLMFAVAFWNDYTNFKLYINNSDLYNFQMKLRDMIMSSDLPQSNDVSENTLKNAAVMVAIIPFMIIYPFCQKYFVKGVNIGAVKE